jgi:hypothetical protein
VDVHESEGESEPEFDDNEARSDREDDLGEDRRLNSDEEERDMHNFIDAGGALPRGIDLIEDVRGWLDLREQIKSDLLIAHRRHAPISHINQLLVLRNFATLRLKGVGRMDASEAIAQQWHSGEGVHFARVTLPRAFMARLEQGGVAYLDC